MRSVLCCAAPCPYGAGTFPDPNGTITIPAEYADDVTCEYLITTGAPIFLRFDSFATEAGYDFVYVYDGISATGTLLGAFSGPAVPPIQLATSGSMFIRFTSDSGTAKAGASMSWSDTMPGTLAPAAAPTSAPTTGTAAPTYSPDGTLTSSPPFDRRRWSGATNGRPARDAACCRPSLRARAR